MLETVCFLEGAGGGARSRTLIVSSLLLQMSKSGSVARRFDWQVLAANLPLEKYCYG